MTNYVVHTDHGMFNVGADNAVVNERGHLMFVSVDSEKDEAVAGFSAGNWNRFEIQEEPAK